MENVCDEPTYPSDHNTVLGGINLLNTQLRGLDERGLILSLAAFAEDSLGTLLAAFMLPIDATKQLLDGISAPLGTFSSRIRAAYALGLVTKDQFEDLERLRKIRNAFSHSWKPISFGDSGIADHIRAINYSGADDEYPETPIDKVRGALSFLLIELQVMADQMTKRGLRASPVGTRLVSGLHGTYDEQIRTAEAKLAKLEEDLEVASEEKRAFLLLVRKRWADRLLLVELSAPFDRRAEVASMRKELQQRIAEAG